jgi:hypothetical protein
MSTPVDTILPKEIQVSYELAVISKNEQGFALNKPFNFKISPEIPTEYLPDPINSIFKPLVDDNNIITILNNRVDTLAGVHARETAINALNSTTIQELQNAILKEKTKINMDSDYTNFLNSLNDIIKNPTLLTISGPEKQYNNDYFMRLMNTNLIPMYNKMIKIINNGNLFYYGKQEDYNLKHNEKVLKAEFDEKSIEPSTPPHKSLLSLLFLVTKTFMRIPIVLLVCSMENNPFTDGGDKGVYTTKNDNIKTLHDKLYNDCFPLKNDKLFTSLKTRLKETGANQILQKYIITYEQKISIDMLCYLLFYVELETTSHLSNLIINLTEYVCKLLNNWFNKMPNDLISGIDTELTNVIKDSNYNQSYLLYLNNSTVNDGMKDTNYVSMLQKLHNKNDRLITFLKIRAGKITQTAGNGIHNDDKTINRRYKAIGNDALLSTDDNILHLGYDDNTSPMYVVESSKIHTDANSGVKTLFYKDNPAVIPVYNNKFHLGPFTKIYTNSQNNNDIATSAEFTDNIYDKLIKNVPVCIIGYGASGSGKTSVLIKLNTPQGQIQDGLLMIISNKLGNTYKKCEVNIKELGIGLGDTKLEKDAFDGSYNFNEKKEWIKFKGTESATDTESATEQKAGINMFDDILYFMENVRNTAKTPNNPVSSRSHVIISLVYKNESGPKCNLIICDLAGVENKFDCININEMDNTYKTILAEPKGRPSSSATSIDPTFSKIDPYVDMIEGEVSNKSSIGNRNLYIHYQDEYKFIKKLITDDFKDDRFKDIFSVFIKSEYNPYFFQNKKKMMSEEYLKIKNAIPGQDGKEKLTNFMNFVKYLDSLKFDGHIEINMNLSQKYSLVKITNENIEKITTPKKCIYLDETDYKVKIKQPEDRRPKYYTIYTNNTSSDYTSSNYTVKTVHEIPYISGPYVLYSNNVNSSNIQYKITCIYQFNLKDDLFADIKNYTEFKKDLITCIKDVKIKTLDDLSPNNKDTRNLTLRKELLTHINTDKVKKLINNYRLYEIKEDMIPIEGKEAFAFIDIEVTSLTTVNINSGKYKLNETENLIYENNNKLNKINVNVNYTFNETSAAANNNYIYFNGDILPLNKAIQNTKGSNVYTFDKYVNDKISVESSNEINNEIINNLYTGDINAMNKNNFITFLKFEFLKDITPENIKLLIEQLLIEEADFNYKSKGGGNKSSCEHRTKEGEYINNTLDDMRRDIAREILQNKKSHMPSFYVKCMPIQCNPEFRDCLGIDRYPVINPNAVAPTFEYGDIIGTIKNLIDEDNFKKMVFCVFCVLNLSLPPLVKEPPSIPFINISDLQYSIELLNNMNIEKVLDSKIQNTIKDILTKLKNSNVLKSLNDTYLNSQMDNVFTLIEELKSENMEVAIINLKILIKNISNINAATPIGTVLFTDSVAKVFADVNTCNITPTQASQTIAPTPESKSAAESKS